MISIKDFMELDLRTARVNAADARDHRAAGLFRRVMDECAGLEARLIDGGGRMSRSVSSFPAESTPLSSPTGSSVRIWRTCYPARRRRCCCAVRPRFRGRARGLRR